MSEPTYGWRTASFEIARNGFCARVEKFWCTVEEGDAEGWRWSAFTPNDTNSDYVPRSSLSETMSREKATRLAEQWIADRIEEAKGLGVYRFAGLEPAP